MFLTQCREVKIQKDEAELYQFKVDELKNAKSDMLMWQLWKGKCDTNSHIHKINKYYSNFQN
jgi:hypothetical protein